MRSSLLGFFILEMIFHLELSHFKKSVECPEHPCNIITPSRVFIEEPGLNVSDRFTAFIAPAQICL